MQVRARATSVLRCVYCHDDLDGDAVSCPRCSTRLHKDCVLGEKCPSLGCTHRFAQILIRIAKRLDPAWRSGSYWFWFIGVIFPVCALFMNEVFEGPLGPREQAVPHAWLETVFRPEPLRFLSPLAAWSIWAYVAWLYGHRRSWIRVGLAGGVLIWGALAGLQAWLIPESAFAVILVIGAVVLAPATSVLTYLHAVIAYHRERGAEDPRETLAGTLGYSSLWVFLAGTGAVEAIVRMNQLYAALPENVSHGDCYQATVAARGDRHVTDARAVVLRDGRTVLVSRQLRRFKAFELVLSALAPRTHRVLRAFYDRVGPPLARRMGPRAATALHVLFVPLERLVALALACLFENPDALVSGTYAGAVRLEE